MTCGRTRGALSHPTGPTGSFPEFDSHDARRNNDTQVVRTVEYDPEVSRQDGNQIHETEKAQDVAAASAGGIQAILIMASGSLKAELRTPYFRVFRCS